MSSRHNLSLPLSGLQKRRLSRENISSSSAALPIGSEIVVQSRGSILPDLTDSSSQLENYSLENLSQFFGDFSVAYTGRVRFLSDTGIRQSTPSPSTESYSSGNGTTGNGMSFERDAGYPVTFEDVRPHLPPEDLAMHLIDLYFETVHPYMPVLNKTQFYNDWQGPHRSSMSPYLLVSLFNCSIGISKDARLYDSPGRLSAMATYLNTLQANYSDLFKDTPRLSSLQSECINLKGLEARPDTPGYFYKSWFQLTCIIRLGRDLGLDRLCASSAQDPDTIAGKRIWQICFIMDQLMGAAQGRAMQINMKEVDLTLLSDTHQGRHGLDPSEVSLHNDFVHLVGLVKILRRCTEVLSTHGVRFPFSAEPQYVALAKILVQWHSNLPKHLKFNLLVETKLPNHFVANLHLTYNMITTVLHRPWAVSRGELGVTSEWRYHLRTCNDASQRSITLHELILDQYGHLGINCMLRGLGFAVYCNVIATMSIVVCLTSSEVEFNHGSRISYDRAIQILERLATFNADPRIRDQIAVLRSTFGPDSRVKESFDAQMPQLEPTTLQARPAKGQQANQITMFLPHSPPVPQQIQDSVNTSLPRDAYYNLSSTDQPYHSSRDVAPMRMRKTDRSSPTGLFGHPSLQAINWSPSGLGNVLTRPYSLSTDGMMDPSQINYMTDSGSPFGSFSPDGFRTPHTANSNLPSRNHSSQGNSYSQHLQMSTLQDHGQSQMEADMMFYQEQPLFNPQDHGLKQHIL